MKRVLHALFGLLSIVCLMGCLFAIWWIWSVKKPAIEKTTQAFDEANKYLSIADKAVVDVNSQLKAQVYLIKTTVRADGDKQGFLGSFFGRSVVRQMAPQFNDAQMTVERVTEASIVVNSILESLQEGPFDSMENLNTNHLRNLQSQMEGVTKASWDISDLLNNPQSNGGESAAQQSQRIADNLETIIGALAIFQQRIELYRTKIQQIKDRTLYWLNIGPTLATIVLGWIAISQMVVLTVAVRWFRRKTS